MVERGRHGAILTPAGERVVAKARAIFASVEDLKSRVGSSGDGLTGRLRLGVLPTIGPYLLPNVTSRLHSLYPDFRILVREEQTLDLDRHLREGRLDTLISAQQDHQNVEAIPLFEEGLWICVAPDHPLANVVPSISLKQLSGMLILSLGYGYNLYSTILDLARLSGAYVSQEYEGTSLDAIRQMAAMGAGVAILPSLYAIVGAHRDPSLIVRRIEHKIARRQISLLWRDTSPMKHQMHPLAETLIDISKALLSKERSVLV